jgi:hypothetical protein
MRRRPGSVLALAAVCLAAAAGCGGGGGADRLSKDDYEQRVGGIVRHSTSQLIKLGLAVARAPNPERAKGRAAVLAGALTARADELEALSPPADAEAANEQLAAALRELAEYAQTNAAKASSTRLRPLQGFENDLIASPGAERMREAIRRLQAEGYELE